MSVLRLTLSSMIFPGFGNKGVGVDVICSSTVLSTTVDSQLSRSVSHFVSAYSDFINAEHSISVTFLIGQSLVVISGFQISKNFPPLFRLLTSQQQFPRSSITSYFNFFPFSGHYAHCPHTTQARDLNIRLQIRQGPTVAVKVENSTKGYRHFSKSRCYPHSSRLS